MTTVTLKVTAIPQLALPAMFYSSLEVPAREQDRAAQPSAPQGPTVLQLCHATLQGIQLFLHFLSLLVAALTEGSSLLLQRQHLGQQLAFKLVHLGVQGGGHSWGWRRGEVPTGWELLLLRGEEEQ